MSVSVMFSYEERQLLLEFEKELSEIKLSEARERLKSEGFFNDESGNDESENYRYVFPTVKLSEDEDDYAKYEDRILGVVSEQYVPLDTMLLSSGDEVVLVNTATADLERPNLIGFRTSFWHDEEMQVTCRLRPRYNDANVPEPYLLTDVITSRYSDYTKVHIPNALVCAQDSIIEFPIACKCTVGMAYSAWMNGERVFDYAIPLAPYTSNEVAYASFDCFNNGEYSDEKKGAAVIKVEKLSAEDIASKEFVSYDITIVVEDILKWTAYENSKVVGVYTKDSKNPNTIIETPTHLSNLKGTMGTNSADQFVLDNKSYFTGKLTPGESLPKRPKGVNMFKVNEKSKNPIGSLTVRILVFKDMETAQRFVARYNPAF